MATTSTITKVSVKMLLNNGTDPQTGEVRTVSVSLGALSPTGYNDDKAMAVAEAIAPCLTKSLYGVKKTVDYTLTNAS